MNLEAMIAELEKTMDDCSGWARGTGTRETVTRPDGMKAQREYSLLPATQAMLALLKAQRTGTGADAAIKQAQRIIDLAQWHAEGAGGNHSLMRSDPATDGQRRGIFRRIKRGTRRGEANIYRTGTRRPLGRPAKISAKFRRGIYPFSGKSARRAAELAENQLTTDAIRNTRREKLQDGRGNLPKSAYRSGGKIPLFSAFFRTNRSFRTP